MVFLSPSKIWSPSPKKVRTFPTTLFMIFLESPPRVMSLGILLTWGQGELPHRTTQGGTVHTTEHANGAPWGCGQSSWLYVVLPSARSQSFTSQRENSIGFVFLLLKFHSLLLAVIPAILSGSLCFELYSQSRDFDLIPII